jgi:hypothetical protein
MIVELAINKVQQIFRRKGYAFFEKGDYNLNIIGVRRELRIANKFDDTLLCLYKEKGNWIWKEYAITTDAGRYWLQNPTNEKGCALLVPNQYRGVYKLDKHNGKYTALCQRLGEVEVYRDNNRDMVLDFDPATIESGMFGINIHSSNPYTESTEVGKWSAGCQVFARKMDYDEFIDTCEIAANKWGNKFSYTLLTKQDIRQ